MGKQFYSLDEVCEMLGKTPDSIRKLVREGTLREFRDAGKIFFKAEDIEQVAPGTTTSGAEDEVLLEAADEPATPPGSPPPPSDGTSVIGLAPVEEDEPDKKEDTVITASGIGVFDDDELEIDADPMAATQITDAPIDDQVALEGTGSGSGLLDLTRESDDTSLGAELLDEIYPGDEAAAEPAVAEAEALTEADEQPAPATAGRAAAPPAAEVAAEPALATAEIGAVVAASRAPAGDPYEGLFSGFLVAALILLAVACSVVGGALQGYLPDYAMLLTNNFYIFLAGAAVVLVLCAVVGMFLGRLFSPRKG